MARRKLDYYPTTPCAGYVIRRWIERNRPEYKGRFFDPAAGPGLLLEYVTDDPGRRVAAEINGFWSRELSNRCGNRWTICDSLEADWGEVAGGDRPYILTNPPFSHADAFLKKALEYGDKYKVDVYFLLRASWTSAKKRLVFPMPTDCEALTWRPSFDGGGGNGFHDYSWMIWRPDRTIGFHESRVTRVPIERRDDPPRHLWASHQRLTTMSQKIIEEIQ